MVINVKLIGTGLVKKCNKGNAQKKNELYHEGYNVISIDYIKECSCEMSQKLVDERCITCQI